MPSRTTPALPPQAVKKIEDGVDLVFDRLKARVLGPSFVGKRLYVTVNQRHSLPGLFRAAAEEEGAIPNVRLLQQLLGVAGNYIDSTRAQTKAKVVAEVQSFLADAHQGGTNTDLQTVLGGRLSEIWSDTSAKVRQIVESEVQHTHSLGVLDGIVQTNVRLGIEDPTIIFICVHDNVLCDECKRLHLLEDGITPRAWKLSQVGHGYHKKGDPTPKIGGLHPHERCVFSTLLPGYGFDASGNVTYKSKDWDEYEKQQKG